MKYLISVIAIIIFSSCSTKKVEDTTSESLDTTALSDEEVEEIMVDDANYMNEVEVVFNLKESGEDGCNCEAIGYLITTNKEGEPVYDLPNGKEVGRLMNEPSEPNIVLNFIEAQDGWLKLEDGRWAKGEHFAVDSRNYNNEDYVLHQFTTQESSIVHNFSTSTNFKIKGCCNSWTFVEDAQGNKGWIQNDLLCANSETMCN